MIIKQKALNMLGLAQRASFLVSGDEQVEKSIKAGKVQLIVLAHDLSQNTQDRYERFAKQYHIELDQSFSREEISQTLGKSRAICGLLNQGMAEKFLSYTIGEDDQMK